MPDHLMEIEPDERIVEIAPERLRDFKDQPFKIRKDAQMDYLIDSISRYGILNPLIVRPLPEGVYEIISGHRRKYAAEKLGYRKLPVIIRNLKDEDAIISLVDSNVYREMIPISEKALAYKMKYNAIKRKSGRRKGSRTGVHNRTKKTVDVMAGEVGESSRQLQRYLKIAELIPELLEMLDEGRLSFNPAYEAAFLTPDQQRDLAKAIDFTQSSPSVSQAQRMKKISQDHGLTLEEIKSILCEVKKGDITRVTFKNEQLRRFFPRNYTNDQIKQAILDLLQNRSKQH